MNGSTATSKTIIVEVTGSEDGNSATSGTFNVPVSADEVESLSGYDMYVDESADFTFRIRPPDGEGYTDELLISSDAYHGRMDSIENNAAALRSEVDPFVNNTWPAFESGAINATDVMSSATVMSEYGTDYDADSNLYNSIAALSALGLDAPNLNGTGTMAITYQSVERHGLVMAREAPNGSWEANTTYNASTIDGPVFILTTDGNKVDITGEFRIGSISSTDGGTVDNVSATKIVYKTSNTSELQQTLDEIEELRKEMEAKEQAAASGSSDSGSGFDPMYLLGALAVVGRLAQRRVSSQFRAGLRHDDHLREGARENREIRGGGSADDFLAIGE